MMNLALLGRAISGCTRRVITRSSKEIGCDVICVPGNVLSQMVVGDIAGFERTEVARTTP